MRVAALYDIHGNLPALEAVLEEVHLARVDAIVIGGDVFPGPMAIETLEKLLALDLPLQFIRGNCEGELLAVAAGDEPAGVPERYRSTYRWLAGRLNAERRRRIGEWPASLRLHIDGVGSVLFCHATPHSDTMTFTRLTPEARLTPIFAGTGPLVICGHTHMPFDRTIGDVRVVNAGSVGMPFGEPGASWLLLGPDVQARRTEYDRARAADRIRATDYPDREEFADRYVLHPPSEEEMLQAFGGADE
ncbi:MAG TPA: metallophosphoesterase family protein [Vicinamibacterales bacterium]